MSKIIFTLGYGLLTGTHAERKEAFRERLRYIQREIGKPIALVDIRQAGSGSRNGVWFREPSLLAKHRTSMSWLVSSIERVYYTHEPRLANHWGQTQANLRLYAYELGFDYDMREAIEGVKAIAKTPEHVVVLMCGCGNAFKKNGTTWNCHRVPLAEALVKELGAEWTAIHLEKIS